MGPAAVRAAIAQLAAGQWGLITTAQATAAGATRMLLTRMAATGELERVIYGVYATPAALADELVEKRALWLSLDPGRSVEERLGRRHESGVMSHATAAALHGIGDILDDRVEVTLPRRQQSRREELRLYKAPLRPDEVTLVDGLPVTTPARTIADLVGGGHDRDHVATVLAEAVSGGLTGYEQVRTALEERLGSQEGREVLGELLAAAGQDAASLERAVISSPIGKRLIDDTVVALLQHYKVPKLPAMKALADLQKQIRRAESVNRLMRPAVETKKLKNLMGTADMVASLQRARGLDTATLGKALGAADLDASLRRIRRMYAPPVPSATWSKLALEPPVDVDVDETEIEPSRQEEDQA